MSPDYAQNHPANHVLDAQITRDPDPRERRPAPPDRSPPAQFYQTGPSLARSGLLGHPQLPLARLAQIPLHSPARDRDSLASPRVPVLLEMEEPVSMAGKTSGAWSDTRADPTDVDGQPTLGCATHPRRVAEARYRSQPSNRVQVQGQARQTTIAVLAHIPGQPRQGHRLNRLLHRTHGNLQSAVRLPRPG